MDAEITIIGAGVIGLAVGEKVSERYRDIFIIERHPVFGLETSSRNSEVIHAGVYYPEGSLKSKLCVEGNTMLYDYCLKNDIPFNKCGKLIVATTSDEIPVIEEIKNNAEKNGVGLDLLDRDKVMKMEPNIFALKALFSPATGIVDTHLLMKRFETNILRNGGEIVYGSEVKGIKKIENGFEITILDTDKSQYSFTTRIIINSAGLSSDKIAEIAGIKDEKIILQFCKGEYFRIKPPKNRLISRLIYPVPYTNLDGVGIHATLDTAGGVKLGPDVTYLDSRIFDFKVSPEKQEFFWKSARRFLPFLEFDDIVPEMAGIRPKIQKSGEPVKDFYIEEESPRGYKGLINLIGIESPGLTCCISIAKYVMNFISR